MAIKADINKHNWPYIENLLQFWLLPKPFLVPRQKQRHQPLKQSQEMSHLSNHFGYQLPLCWSLAFNFSAQLEEKGFVQKSIPPQQPSTKAASGSQSQACINAIIPQYCLLHESDKTRNIYICRRNCCYFQWERFWRQFEIYIYEGFVSWTSLPEQDV